MDLNKTSWEKRWQAPIPGFHQSQVNARLQEHTEWLAGESREGVYVPLCGASVDIDWLATQFERTVGTELVETAVHRFFEDRSTTPVVDSIGPYQRHTAGSIQLLLGDALALTREHLSPVSAWYDRAAMIALRPELRRRYVATLRHVLPTGARGLLVTLEYDQQVASGPPWSVTSEEVLSAYSGFCDIEQVHHVQAERTPPKFGEAPVFEVAYRLVVTS